MLILKQTLPLIVIWNNGIYACMCVCVCVCVCVCMCVSLYFISHYTYYFLVKLIVCFCQPFFCPKNMNLWTEVFSNENYYMSFSEYWVFSEGSFIVLISQLFLLISMQIAIADINAKCNCCYWRLVLGNQRFPVRVRLLAMCRGELSVVIVRRMSKCL